jgi:predicted nucleotidyltransferase
MGGLYREAGSGIHDDSDKLCFIITPMSKIRRPLIRKFAKQVAKQFNPQKIVLFGSYAYGKPTEDSDVDILVVMPFKGRNPEKATEIWMAIRPKFPIYIIVRKPAEINKRIKMGDFFIREIVEKGKVLYEVDHA